MADTPRIDPLRAEVDEAAARHLPSVVEEPKGAVGKVKVFLELVKFEHSIFALPYAYIGALYGAWVWTQKVTSDMGPAGSDLSDVINASDSTGRAILSSLRWVTPHGWPSWQALLWITIAMVGARSFAFVVNRAVDKEIDARNPRTAGRAIPAGLIKAWELWLFSAIVLGAFLFSVWQLHPVTRLLWPIVLVAFIIYPYTKRFTPLCHYWLGLCLGLAPVGAWVGVTGDLSDPAPWVFGSAVAIWTAGFDMIYATQDIECDVRDGIHSMPADFGIPASLLQTRIMHVLTVALLVLGGWLVGAGWPYYVGAAIAAGLLLYENAIVSPKDLSRVDAAFFTTNGVIAMVLLAGVVVDRLVG